MKLLVLLNEAVASLDGAKPDDVRRRVADSFADARADAEVRIIDPRWLNKHVQEVADGVFDAVVAGGGDSMLNAVANIVAELGRKPFGVLPLGKQNHFAEALGFPVDLDAAVRALAGASIAEMLVGELNGRIFLSYAAVGLDPLAVLRPQLNGSVPPPETLIYPAPRRHDVHLSTRGRTVVAAAPGIIVSNNAPQIRAFGIKPAAPPEPGLFNVYVARRPQPHGIVSRLLHRIPGYPALAATHFQPMTLPEMRVDSPRNRKVIVCIDGEMLQVRPPLHFRMRPVPLRVLAPARQ